MAGSARAAPCHSTASSAARTLLHGALYLAILLSPIVLVEPAPYEFGIALLALTCLMARVPFDPRVVPAAILLIVWNVGGCIAVLNVLGRDGTAKYVAVSVFMAVSSIVFACLFAQDTIRRLGILRRAYVFAAAAAALVGSLAYFRLVPSPDTFMLNSRVSATFKDPNVFGPFLVLPLLLLVQRFILKQGGLFDLIALLITLCGLFLSFSRGAWFHFASSGALMVFLMFITAPDVRTRARITFLTIAFIGAAALLIVFALSFDAVGGMFEERARLVQSYDAGSSIGQFNLQVIAVKEFLDNPFGMGPYAFQDKYGLQQHNVYLQALLVYGWGGGAAYIALVLMTLVVGLRASVIRADWQPYLIAAYGAFVGEVLESFIIDSDHWRHYFLLLGMVWGLSAASLREARMRMSQRPS